MNDRRHTQHLLPLAAALFALTGCDLITAPPYQPPAAGQDVEVTVTPGDVTLGVNQEVQFAAGVTGAADTTVTWTATCGAVTAGGAYTAPAAAGSCVVTARSNAAPAVTGSAVVTVTATPPPVAITIAPGTTAATACRTVQFTATVTGSTNRNVTWRVQEANGGTVSASGLYTAPQDAGQFHVVATAAADTTKTAIATVNVSTQVVSVAVSPSTLTLPASGTVQFTATVTTSCGAFTSVRTLSPDGTIQ